MEFSEDWKTKWRISSTCNPPLLISNPENLGPLSFQPIFQSLSHLSTTSPPYSSFTPSLSLPRFLHTSSSPFLPPSLASSLSHSITPDQHKQPSSPINNCLQLLTCPPSSSSDNNDIVIAFFPTGDNADQIGFIRVRVAADADADADASGSDVFVSSKKLHHRILQISVNALDNPIHRGTELTFGYLFVSTLYSVHWYTVMVKALGLKNERISLVHVNEKLFKSCAVVNACWNPHLSEGCLVLLENGDLFLFQVDSFSKCGGKSKGTRLKVSFDAFGKRKWLGCCFSWHPQIVIIASSDAVFLVDYRLPDSKVSYLANNEALRNGSVGSDEFVVFSRAGVDGLYFTVASNCTLSLYDIRKPMVPVLQWNHTVKCPSYIEVFSLSQLRSHAKDDKYNGASESGYCIIMGSFWNNEFCVFCYGLPLLALKGSTSSKITKFYNSTYAWELPSQLSVSGCECRCGSCLTREEFLKDSLPEWIDLQQKKVIVLGFGILNRNASKVYSESYEYGGFSLIRLTSSGKLELQRYSASWDCVSEFKETHRNPCMKSENYFLYSTEGEEYKFPKRFNYFRFDCIYAFLNSTLLDVIKSRKEELLGCPKKKHSLSVDIAEELFEKLKGCGVTQIESSPSISTVMKETTFPTTIHELAVTKMWIDLPSDLLKLAFSCYSELLEVADNKKMSIEFLAVPDKPQVPPFILRKSSGRSNKWSNKVPRGTKLVGPVVPLPFLCTLHDVCETNMDRYETKLTFYSNEVKQEASDTSMSDLSFDLKNHPVVSLAKDGDEESWSCSPKSKHFLYKHDCGSDKNKMFATLIPKRLSYDPIADKTERVGLEMFDDLCPVGLKFDSAVNIGEQEFKSFKMLKKQYSRWQNNIGLYQNFCDMFQTTKAE